jgi:membrane-bound metal-dependent hydrolase YbcI (DUF457 family)
MLGYSHATSGALVWLATAPALSQALTGAPMSAPELAAGTVICAGAALLPDLDHPQATIAHTFGPVSHVASKLTFILSGGHRQGTHSLLFSVGFGLFAMLTGVASHAWHSTTPLAILVFLLAAFAFRGLNLVLPKTSSSMKGIVVVVQAAVLSWGLLAFNLIPDPIKTGGDFTKWWWLGAAATLGCLAHLAGDSLTPEGVPWLYPNRWRLAIPLISHTGNVVEKLIVGPLFTLGVFWFIWVDFAHLIPKR